MASSSADSGDEGDEDSLSETHPILEHTGSPITEAVCGTQSEGPYPFSQVRDTKVSQIETPVNHAVRHPDLPVQKETAVSLLQQVYLESDNSKKVLTAMCVGLKSKDGTRDLGDLTIQPYCKLTRHLKENSP